MKYRLGVLILWMLAASTKAYAYPIHSEVGNTEVSPFISTISEFLYPRNANRGYFSVDKDVRAALKNSANELDTQIKSSRFVKGGFSSYKERFDSYIDYCLNAANDRAFLAFNKLAKSSNDLNAYDLNSKIVIELYQSALRKVNEAEAAVHSSEHSSDITYRIELVHAVDQALTEHLTWSYLKELSEEQRSIFTELLQLVRCRMNINNAEVIKTIIADNGGWLKRSEFGRKIEAYAFIAVHNTSHDLKLFEDILVELKSLQEIGEVRNHHYPNLHDVLAYYNNKPQKFGWFLSCIDGVYAPSPALEDPENVDNLRAQYRLKPLEVEIERRTKRRPCNAQG